MSRQEYLARWSALHGGATTGGLVGWWLGISHTVARPLVRSGVGPWPVTAAGVAVAVATVWPAGARGRWPLPAGPPVRAARPPAHPDGAGGATGRRPRRGRVGP